MIAVVDYGAGNLQSVCKALCFIGAEACIADTPEAVERADAVILPGVGAFGDAVRSLAQSGLLPAVRDAAVSDKPFLGICLGMQMLFPNSEESVGADGLCLLPGTVRRFPSMAGLKVPQIGWNALDITPGCPLYRGVPNGSFVYFVHSYYVQAQLPQQVAASAVYGIPFHASVADTARNLYATQFHPEKSGAVGLQILRNFAEMQKGAV